jgi:hypothetical protein
VWPAVRLTTLLLSVSRLFRKCGICDVSQPYRPPWAVTRIPSLFLFVIHFLIFLFLERSLNLKMIQGYYYKFASFGLPLC